MHKTIALAAAALSLALGAGQASAHARLIKADPKGGTTVAPPSALHLQFSERIVPAKSSVALTGPAGAVRTGPVMVDAKTKHLVTVSLPGPLAPGAYKVKWTMTTEDTHTMQESYSFQVK
jgi:methionine-rich copper-binding protein CopC